jgi:pimeloyl-ACP methyl ester carboxylesterase
MARVLAGTGGVVAFDFRGHGGSGGVSTVGDLEVLDLAAAVGWARLLGYRRIVPVGFSMGAGVAVRYAALAAGTPDAVDALVAVSAPSRWHYRGTPPMRLLHRGVETVVGRRVLAAGFGTRIAARGWDPWPAPPDALVARVAPAPLLVVHGDADRFFPLEHARWLVEAARGPVELWVEPGFGHAEAAVTPQLLRRVAAWALSATTR